MNYQIEVVPYFERRAKRLIKKYPSLKKELKKLGVELSQNPNIGDFLGNNCYKIRLAIASKGKGKSGGARIITHLYVDKKKVYFLDIYNKSDQSTISEKEIIELIKKI